MPFNVDQDEIDARLLDLTLECARPSWRFRLLFSAHERQLLGFAINTFKGQRNANLFIHELERRYGPNLGRNTGGGEAAQVGTAR